MKKLTLIFIGTCIGILSFSFQSWAHDPDLKDILEAVQATSCSQVQVLIAKNIGVVRWSQGSMRYLYDDDIAPLKTATLKSGKRTIDVDQDFQIPDTSDSNWTQVEDQLESELTQIFSQDYQSHPPSGC